MIDPKLIESIIRVWNDDQAHPERCRTKRQLYPLSVLKLFIEEAFFASLSKEEGIVPRFSAVLVSKSDATDPMLNYRTEIQVFENPLPFTVSAIPKVSPAFDPHLSSLAVAPDDEGQLLIWGVFSYEPTFHYYNEVQIVVEGTTYIRPDFLTVSTVAPGSLIFSRQNSMLGRLSNGYFVPATPTPFASSSLGHHLIRLIERTDAWKQHGPDYLSYAIWALEILLDQSAARGHGGTIVFLDYSDGEPRGLFVPKYHLQGQQRLGPRICNCASSSKNLTGNLGYRKITFETIQRVAQLTAVDGALVMNSAFDVLTFGATLTAPRWTGKALIGPDALGQSIGESFDVTRYGTRHNSALDFAASCSNSIVFVISQDEAIRAFVRADESTVMCWLDCTTSMFV